MDEASESQPRGTADVQYTRRLRRLQTAGWKRALDVQRPYRWKLRRLHPGFTLDVGCGIGRNLEHLDGHGVGVDHNAESVELVRSRGLTAFTPEEFLASPHAQRYSFDSLLCAHVLEHMSTDDAVSLLESYLPFVRPGGQVILITPQEAGYRSDNTHVSFVDFDALGDITGRLHLEGAKRSSFPFPRAFGRWFKYNEFLQVAKTPVVS
jgi:2-polyprenyl-3-methyl-5-hydroxy-6-metoxy-1,4-benzoquinol methylase